MSLLHEYAVGLLWDALQGGNAVEVKTIDGSMSGNLLDGVDKVVIPDSMQPIGGYIPDLGLLGKDLRPVRVIEVLVTQAPKKGKLERLQSRGVDIVQVPVRNEEELKDLVTSVSDGQKPRWAYRWKAWVFDRMGIINLPRRQHIKSSQTQANNKIQELIATLTGCEPEMRRQLTKVLAELDSLESLYPLSPKNPKADTIRSAIHHK